MSSMLMTMQNKAIHDLPSDMIWWELVKTPLCRVPHTCVSKLTIIIGSDNGSSPDRHQSMIWTTTGILLIGPSGTNKLKWTLNRNSWIFIRENTIENVVWKIMAILSRHQCVKIAIILPPRNKRRTPIVWVILRLHSWITLEFWNYKQVLWGPLRQNQVSRP